MTTETISRKRTLLPRPGWPSRLALGYRPKRATNRGTQQGPIRSSVLWDRRVTQAHQDVDVDSQATSMVLVRPVGWVRESGRRRGASVNHGSDPPSTSSASWDAKQLVKRASKGFATGARNFMNDKKTMMQPATPATTATQAPVDQKIVTVHMNA
jgi:hypothetical protein